MFSKKSFSADRIDTLIGKNTTFEGTVKAEGTVRVDGSIIGELIITGNLIMGEGSTIKGNITADNAYISGIVEGNITAGSQLHMTSTAKVKGDITVKNVVVDEGAVFIGNCKSTSEQSQ
ncbi:MAG: bactofilin family protein [Bacillota bacterium]